MNGGIEINSPAITLAERSSLVAEVNWEIFPVVERKRVNTGRFCTVRSACRNSLNMDHSFKPVPFRVIKVCASSKQSVITGLGWVRALFFFFPFFNLLGVGDGGGSCIESINLTRVARASQGGYSLEFFDLGET